MNILFKGERIIVWSAKSSLDLDLTDLCFKCKSTLKHKMYICSGSNYGGDRYKYIHLCEDCISEELLMAIKMAQMIGLLKK